MTDFLDVACDGLHDRVEAEKRRIAEAEIITQRSRESFHALFMDAIIEVGLEAQMKAQPEEFAVFEELLWKRATGRD